MRENFGRITTKFFGLEGKVAIVTGAGNGIGACTAKMFADLGASVTACDIEADNVERVAREIRDAGGKAIGRTCDITDTAQIEDTVRQTLDAFGAVDILANVGASCGGGIKVENMTGSEWARLIEINLTGVYNFIMQVLPIMRKKKYGKIINVSSDAAISGEDTDVHYSAAKGGVISLSRTLAKELKDDRINVNVVAPGLIRTRMAHEWEFESALKRWYRVGEPEDAAGAIIFLASDASDYISGQTIVVKPATL
jgi:NAD(P)-dependent dehydrogenase (short-subunit alcohol dehydrogenase family)